MSSVESGEVIRRYRELSQCRYVLEYAPREIELRSMARAAPSDHTARAASDCGGDGLQAVVGVDEWRLTWFGFVVGEMTPIRSPWLGADLRRQAVSHMPSDGRRFLSQ